MSEYAIEELLAKKSLKPLLSLCNCHTILKNEKVYFNIIPLVIEKSDSSVDRIIFDFGGVLIKPDEEKVAAFNGIHFIHPEAF